MGKTKTVPGEEWPDGAMDCRQYDYIEQPGWIRWALYPDGRVAYSRAGKIWVTVSGIGYWIADLTEEQAQLRAENERLRGKLGKIEDMAKFATAGRSGSVDSTGLIFAKSVLEILE